MERMRMPRLPWWYLLVKWGVPILAAMSSALLVLAYFMQWVPVLSILPQFLHVLPSLFPLDTMLGLGLLGCCMAAVGGFVGWGTAFWLRATVLLHTTEPLAYQSTYLSERCQQLMVQLKHATQRLENVVRDYTRLRLCYIGAGQNLEDFDLASREVDAYQSRVGAHGAGGLQGASDLLMRPCMCHMNQILNNHANNTNNTNNANNVNNSGNGDTTLLANIDSVNKQTDIAPSTSTSVLEPQTLSPASNPR